MRRRHFHNPFKNGFKGPSRGGKSTPKRGKGGMAKQRSQSVPKDLNLSMKSSSSPKKGGGEEDQEEEEVQQRRNSNGEHYQHEPSGADALLAATVAAAAEAEEAEERERERAAREKMSTMDMSASDPGLRSRGSRRRQPEPTSAQQQSGAYLEPKKDPQSKDGESSSSASAFSQQRHQQFTSSAASDPRSSLTAVSDITNGSGLTSVLSDSGRNVVSERGSHLGVGLGRIEASPSAEVDDDGGGGARGGEAEGGEKDGGGFAKKKISFKDDVDDDVDDDDGGGVGAGGGKGKGGKGGESSEAGGMGISRAGLSGRNLVDRAVLAAACSSRRALGNLNASAAADGRSPSVQRQMAEHSGTRNSGSRPSAVAAKVVRGGNGSREVILSDLAGTSVRSLSGGGGSMGLGGRRVASGVGVGGVKGVGAAAGRPRRASYAINDLKIDSSTQWGEGVAVIESVLEPGSKTAEALSPSQRLGLRNVQLLLLRHGAGGMDSLGGNGSHAHIPRALLGRLNRSRSDETQKNVVKRGNDILGAIYHGDESDDGMSVINEEDEESSRYLLSHFGGVQGRKRTVEETKSKVKKVVMAHAFMTSLMGASSRNRVKDEVYMPPEWERLSSDAKRKLRDVLSWENLSKWEFNVLELSELSGGNPLLMVGWALLGSPISLKHISESSGGDPVMSSQLEGYGFDTSFSFSHQTLCGFLRTMEGEYDRNNPYHNNIHAADVLQTVHSLLQMGGKDFVSADIQSFSIMLAAIMHDVAHPGYNNAYQVNAKSDLALRYNDISVLENMHVSRAFNLIMGHDSDQSINVLSRMNPTQQLSVRKIIIDAILHTDMTKHFAMVDQMKGLLVSSDEEEIKKNHSVDVLNYMLHLADISNPAKPAPMFLEWTDRCLAEFFAQGDKEKERGLPVSPLCDRDKTSRKQSQVGFISFVVEPAYEVMAKVLPKVDETVMHIIKDNLDYWKCLPEDKKKKKLSVAAKSVGKDKAKDGKDEEAGDDGMAKVEEEDSKGGGSGAETKAEAQGRTPEKDPPEDKGGEADQ